MTVTLRLNNEQLERKLEQAAEQEGISRTEFLRRCLQERLEGEQPKELKRSAYELGKHLFGKYSSDRSDLARRSEEIVREKIHAKKGRG